MKKLIIILSSLILIGIMPVAVFAKADNISISAESAVLYLPETEELVYEKNADERMPMASTTKIMTALVVLSEAERDELVIIPEEAVGIEGSSAYLKGGEELTIEELLYALLLQSANDVATALAYHVGGDIRGFSDMMNAKAEELGLNNTHFTNPHGLDDDEHYTTARDLAIIAAKAMENETFRNIVSSKRKSFASDTRRRTYINHNKLLCMYDGCVGVKTGFTKKSGRCLVSAAEREGLTFITVTLDAPNDWEDHKKLLNYGYLHIEKIALCTENKFRYEIPIIGGEKDTLSVGSSDAKSVILPRGEHEVQQFVKLTRYAVAPIKKGDIVGEVIFTVDGNEAGRTRLYSLEDVKEQKEKGFIERILSLFK